MKLSKAGKLQGGIKKNWAYLNVLSWDQNIFFEVNKYSFAVDRLNWTLHAK